MYDAHREMMMPRYKLHANQPKRGSKIEFRDGNGFRRKRLVRHGETVDVDESDRKSWDQWVMAGILVCVQDDGSISGARKRPTPVKPAVVTQVDTGAARRAADELMAQERAKTEDALRRLRELTEAQTVAQPEVHIPEEAEDIVAANEEHEDMEAANEEQSEEIAVPEIGAMSKSAWSKWAVENGVSLSASERQMRKTDLVELIKSRL